MSNPYTQPSLTGYNANPPSDDGTETSSNNVKWATHTNKIGDPLKTFIEGVDSATLAAFGLVLGAAVVAKSATFNVATSERGRFFSVTGTSTANLPAAATAGSGFPLAIVNNGTATVTVDGDGSETINGLTTVTLFPRQGIVLTSDGANWYGVGNYVTVGSFTPNYSDGFSTDPTGDFTYHIDGNTVVVQCPTDTGISNTAGLTVDNVPTAIRPAGNYTSMVTDMQDNSSRIDAVVNVSTSGTFNFIVNSASNWTASGLKGFAVDGGVSIFRYPLRMA